MRDYPGRFIGLAQIWEPEANDDARLEELERAIVEHGNRGLYFSVEPFSVMQLDVSLNDPMFDSLWALVPGAAGARLLVSQTIAPSTGPRCLCGGSPSWRNGCQNILT